MATRIQRRRTRGWRKPEGVIYVGRPTKWCNPYRPQRRHVNGVEFWVSFPLKRALVLVAHHPTEAGAVRECVERFRAEALRPSWIERLMELEGKDLACWCPLDQPCHADVLLEIANGGAA